MSTTAHRAENEVSILARISGDEPGQLSEEMARHIPDLGFSDRDKARMHDLAVRNQEDGLSPAEKEELPAFGEAGDLLSILKSRARRTLKIKPKKRHFSLKTTAGPPSPLTLSPNGARATRSLRRGR